MQTAGQVWDGHLHGQQQSSSQVRRGISEIKAKILMKGWVLIILLAISLTQKKGN